MLLLGGGGKYFKTEDKCWTEVKTFTVNDQRKCQLSGISSKMSVFLLLIYFKIVFVAKIFDFKNLF